MRTRSAESGSPSSDCRSNPQTPNGTPPPPPDLFGHVPEAAPARPTKPTTAAAEWPASTAERTPRTVPVYGAPDRPPASAPRPPANLAGTYERHGSRLDRTAPEADGVTLWVRTSTRPRKAPTDSGRFIDVGHPGGGRPAYAGNLYDRRRPGVPGPSDDLSGHAFQYGPRGAWYLFRLDGPGRYRVEPVSRRRGSGRP